MEIFNCWIGEAAIEPTPNESNSLDNVQPGLLSKDEF